MPRLRFRIRSAMIVVVAVAVLVGVLRVAIDVAGLSRVWIDVDRITLSLMTEWDTITEWDTHQHFPPNYHETRWLIHHEQVTQLPLTAVFIFVVVASALLAFALHWRRKSWEWRKLRRGQVSAATAANRAAPRLQPDQSGEAERV